MQATSSGLCWVCGSLVSTQGRIWVGVEYPNPDRKMPFSRVKQMLHANLRVRRHILRFCVTCPVLGSIFSEGKSLQTVTGDGLIEMQENSQTGLCDKRMGG